MARSDLVARDGRHLGDDRLAKCLGLCEAGAGLGPRQQLAEGAKNLGKVGTETDDVRLLGDALLEQGDAAAIDVPRLVLATGGGDHPSQVIQSARQLGTSIDLRSVPSR